MDSSPQGPSSEPAQVKKTRGGIAQSQALNITHNLTNVLGLAIVRGEYAEALPSEAEICNQYGVSRSSTREAVKMLAAKGLIRSRPKQGIRVQPERNWNMFDSEVLRWILVSKPTLGLLKEFLEVRVVVEPQAAFLAANTQDVTAIAALQTALARLEHDESGLDDPIEADIEFHSAMLEATGNRFYVQMIDFISTAVRVTNRYSHKVEALVIPDVGAYKAVLEAVSQGDGKLAKARMTEVVEKIISSLILD